MPCSSSNSFTSAEMGMGNLKTAPPPKMGIRAPTAEELASGSIRDTYPGLSAPVKWFAAAVI